MSRSRPTALSAPLLSSLSPPEPPTRSHRLRALAAVCLLAVLVVRIDVRTSGRTRPPTAVRLSAVEAFQAASGGPAARWAPEAVRAAGHALRDALLAWSREESRLLPLRDFRPVSARLTAAAAVARDAARLGGERRARAVEAAEKAVADARSVEVQAAALLAATSLPDGQREHLQRARLLVREAEGLLREDEVEAAGERADRAAADLRGALGPPLEAAGRYTSREQIASWRRWVEETRAFSRSTGQTVILVLKEKNRLVLLQNGSPVRTYDAEVGRNALGVKERQGDRATPEGRYRIVKKRDHGQSGYHRALLLDYPNAADRARFAAAQGRGEIPKGEQIGGLIEIHGEGGRGRNWTEGCVALSNPDIDDLFSRVDVGTRVTIVGGDGRDGAFSDLLARVGGASNAAP
ncbi:MAG TPA: L,D-transpeptidase [Vicinamibacteria bacterium]|nr:L,D-transpeptidase [Vicinamibacteria bacterium]